MWVPDVLPRVAVILFRGPQVRQLTGLYTGVKRHLTEAHLATALRMLADMTVVLVSDTLTPEGMALLEYTFGSPKHRTPRQRSFADLQRHIPVAHKRTAKDSKSAIDLQLYQNFSNNEAALEQVRQHNYMDYVLYTEAKRWVMRHGGQAIPVR
eukprot:m.544963 g.544963  ORF g.544963 m.544963 type:complete len:153 (+) comp22142_c0_seq22:2064-2522(+)